MNRQERTDPTRRRLLGAGGIFAAVLAGVGASRFLTADEARAASFEVTHTKEEWRKRLTPMQYRVLRNHDTERPGSSPLDHEKRAGIFHCAGCDLPLFSSKTKYDSGTGWPSFYAPLPNAIGTQEDNTLFMTRTEVHCRRCGGHLGHVFDDGPPPTGKRYCMNGVAMTFKPDETVG
ncbi:Peptide methionine sulfoxide reductase MsrB [Hartmannibacter diazotrophicus]|uniref:peptide-methionine (R)-S-oxide reductase n=1 Tax=Hartmannibacter diazotrophicus TaxID=1482074 RepID=A0A2C9DDB1_9HYPH|nr:peptide-methionine (R)-S-oxide reductase MsrB [Hartmannibacter diazotrophicus]SON58304.1 Peptide methionine sulfoxide reductase MsrB [Hartmannibacter diazotrophicus]